MSQKILQVNMSKMKSQINEKNNSDNSDNNFEVLSAAPSHKIVISVERQLAEMSFPGRMLQ